MHTDTTPTSTPSLLLTQDQVAGMLGCSRRTLEKWVREGRIEPVRFSARMVRYTRDDVEAFIARRGGRVNEETN